MLKATSLMIGLFLIPLFAYAGQVQQIHFEGNRLSIKHVQCQQQSLIQEPTKLIIPFKNCSSYAGELLLTHSIAKKVHWAQHDKNTVWVVVTLKPDYQFETQAITNQFNLCFPKCNQSLAWHVQSVSKMSIKPQITLFKLGGIPFMMPLQDMGIDEFMDKSIGFLPKDVIRDGLPHFGSQRGDWLGKPRKHKGYDIYTNNINVLAMADGEVVAVKPGKLSGIYVKIKHEKQLYTLYVHLTSVNVQEGDSVTQGQVIGRIDGAAGNAIQPQLHFEIKPNDKSIDPLPLIELHYQDNVQISQKIQHYKKQIPAFIRYREQQLQQYLKHKHD
ncbi:M23 family metallopeptidase [Candidatus Albibeggiatoa sp. nov. NOAA]|uniref:M23 family metallopeptidase n=1 Tax=Candidatus Albibeggiatoa sp. nov. NOAA TaxID=3162724 RepID=UPI0032FC8B22|nr:M23 family metallopeptidase [Thiotrichaceae bacterium]